MHIDITITMYLALKILGLFVCYFLLWHGPITHKIIEDTPISTDVSPSAKTVSGWIMRIVFAAAFVAVHTMAGSL